MTPFKHANNLGEAMQHIRNGMGVSLKGQIVTELAEFLYEENADSKWDLAEPFIKAIWLKEAREVLRLYLEAPAIH